MKVKKQLSLDLLLHYNHMMKPTLMSPGSIMPQYGWLLDDDLDTSLTAAKIRAMQTMGVPYAPGYDKQATKDLMKQAEGIKENLAKDKIKTPARKEIIALIAYLQRMGTDIKSEVATPLAAGFSQ